jgi:dTDP-4-dehydrorhamnose reductase
MARRIIITGSRGQLGQCLVRRVEADPRYELAAAWTHADLDIGDREAVLALFDRVAGETPEVLINAAAFTAVDACESEQEASFRVNAEAPGWLAKACRRAHARLVHVSTDYVFDGKGAGAYSEDSPTGPRTAYGRGKLEGEARVLDAAPDSLIVRTSWVFGPGKNFVAAILRQARLRRSGEVTDPLRVVDDQTGSPTYAGDLAEGILELVERGATGVYHLSNAQLSKAAPASWWDFAREILDQTGHSDLVIERIKTADLKLPAVRPANSLLDSSRAAALGVSLRPWPEALRAYLESPDRPADLGGG